MSRGKIICNELKAVRRRIAEENGIPLEIKECTYHGPCRGTCPRCEAEVRYLERELEKRIRLGRVATVAGVALGLASCGGGTPQDNTNPNTHLMGTGGRNDSIIDTDTTKHIADTAKQIWREPTDDYIVTGDLCIMPIDTLYEEGEVGIIIDEIDPVFPGGEEALYRFLSENIKYPQLAWDNAIQGKVYVTFVVETDGSVSNVRILRDIGGGCGLEAKRVVEMMPKWKPGKQGGKVVRTQYNLPINFVLPEDRPRVIEGGAILQGMPIDSSDYDVSPYSPTQQMEVEGVKVIVR